MKRKFYHQILAAEAFLLVLFFLLKASLPEFFTSIMAFPFEQIARGLRELSLSGSTGNLIALFLYILICLVPVMIYAVLYRRKAIYREDLLLFVLSGVMFAVLYLMINPGMAGIFAAGSFGFSPGNAFLGGVVYSVLSTYLAVKALRIFKNAQKKEIEKYLILLMGFLNVVFVFNVFGLTFGSYLEARKSFLAGNTVPGQELLPSEIFLILQHVTAALPYLLNILIVNYLMDLIDEVRKNRFSEDAVTKAERLTRLSVKIIAVTVLTNMTVNLLQFVFMNQLYKIHGNLSLPLMPLIFILAVLLYTQMVKENKTLKEDNELFI